MHLIVMRFQIPNAKIHEFNLALDRLVKWPVYALHGEEMNLNHKSFELVRNWENKTLMKNDLNSAEYKILMGAIKVLGEIKESHIYNTLENKNLLQES
jgi:hypothetical protein